MLGAAYTLDRELGGGGMSRVFTATESALGRKVVVKVLPPEVAAGVKVERFKREIQFLARLNHPHIVPLLAAGGDGGLSYYVMPFMQGESLRSHLLRRGEIPPGEAVRTLREVASALAFAHQNAIVHRDIKPDNVMITGGSAMVTDFGVAKALSVSTADGDPNALTSLGIALGTPSYIAPEQATADPHTDHRADIYSFGAMAYEMLSGRPPFSARSPQAMLAAHITEQPVPLSERKSGIPPALSALVMLCLEKLPDRRPQTAGEIVILLDKVVSARDEASGGGAVSSVGRDVSEDSGGYEFGRGDGSDTLAGDPAVAASEPMTTTQHLRRRKTDAEISRVYGWVAAAAVLLVLAAFGIRWILG